MKAKIFALLLFFLIISCKKEPYNLSTDWQEISGRVQFKESGGFLELKSGKFEYKIPHSRLPYKRIVLLNASLVGYFAELGQESKIAGISSPEYIYSEKVLNQIMSGTTANVGNEQKYNIEKILALNPDAVITNHIASFDNTYDLLKKNGIEVIFLDEYLEENPIEKSKYLLVFGKLLGMDKVAASHFNDIKTRYDSLKNLTSKIGNKPLVIASQIYGNQWFMPGGKTQAAQFIRDAGGDYLLRGNSEKNAVTLSFEEVLVRSAKAKVWVNAGNHKNKGSMLAVNPNYSKMNVFRKGKIYALTGREKGKANDFFESGVVRSDLVLKDYVIMINPKVLPHDSLTYMKELK